MHSVVGRTRFLPFRRPEAKAGRVDPLQDEVPEVGRHLLPAGATVVEVKNHDRDYDRNGRYSHHHRQVDACRENNGNISSTVAPAHSMENYIIFIPRRRKWHLSIWLITYYGQKNLFLSYYTTHLIKMGIKIVNFGFVIIYKFNEIFIQHFN